MVVLGNCRESESDKAIDYSEEFDCFYFPPSPTYFPPSPTTFPLSPSYFPLYSSPSPPPPSSSNSSVRYVWTAVAILLPQNELGEDIVDLPDFRLALMVEYKIQDRGGALDVIPSGRLVKINELVQGLDDIVDSEAKNTALELVDEAYRLPKNLFPDFEPLEKQNEDIVDQLVIDSVGVTQRLIQYRDGALYRDQVGGVSRLNGSELTWGQLLTSTAETGLIFQTKLSLRVWQGHRGQWVADICYGWNWLNTGTLKTAKGAPISSESVVRYRGGKDLFDYPFSELFVEENRAEPTTAPRTEIQTLELSPTEEQEKPDEDFELGCSEATGNDGVEAEATRNDGVEAVGIGGCNGCEGTRIEEVIQSTLKYACREYGIHIWPPHTNATPMLVDQEEVPPLNSDTLPSDQALTATVDTNSVLVEEIPPPLILPTTQKENQDKDLGNDEVEVAGIMGEGTKEGEIAEVQLNSGPFGKRKRKEKTPGGERGNKKTTRNRNVIPLEEILQIKEMLLKDAAKHLKVSQSKLKSSCREYGIHRWPPRDEHKLVMQSLPDENPSIVDQDGILQLISNCVPSNQPLMATDNTNSVVKEIPPPWISPAARQENRDENFATDEAEVIGMGSVGRGEGEMEVGQLNSGCSGKGKRMEKTSRGERGSNKTTRVRIAIPLEDILQTKEMRLKDAAKHLNVSQSTLKHNLTSQSHPNETPAVVHQAGIPQYSDNLPTDQALAVTVDTNSVVVKEILPPQFLPTARQENPNEDFGGDKIEAVGMGGEGTGEGEIEEDQLNSRCLGKRKMKEKSTGGERRNAKATGVRIGIPLEDILQFKEMILKDAANYLHVGRSTLKRACREYGIHRWPPHKKHKLISQPRPNESPAVVQQERISQLNFDTLPPSNQVSANVDTSSVIVKARYRNDITIKFRLCRPWGMEELEQQVKKRLELDARTYYIKYRDEDNELISIACDEDLQDCIFSSKPLGTTSIELLLEPN